MREYRRFELHKGNKEKFWEIKRYDKNLYFREGNIKRKTGEKEPTVSREEKKDFRVAQLAYDKEIQRKLSFGYTEVQNASKPSEELDFQAIRLQSLDGNHTLDLSEAEAGKVLNYMIDRLVINRRSNLLNISKWERRTLHRTEYKSLSEIDPLGPDFPTHFDKWLTLSERDRSYNEEEVIPVFKFLDPQYWIITSKECLQIAQSIQGEIDKRRDVLNTSDKEASKYFQLKETWLNFNRTARVGGGYQIIPCSLQFHSTKHGHRFFMDVRSWNDIYNTLSTLKIWDNSAPAYQKKYASIEEHLQVEVLKQWDLDYEPEPLTSEIRSSVQDQLLTIADEINEAYRDILAVKKPALDHSGVVLIEHGFKWNATTLNKVTATLSQMSDEPFQETLLEFYEEHIYELAEMECEDGNLDSDTRNVINEILNDACHLLNHTHQNIHNTDENLLPTAEDETGNVMVLPTLDYAITTLKNLYPDIASYEFSEDEPAGQTYTHRPAGLDEELMTDWLHLLPDAGVCLQLLQDYLAFAKIQEELRTEYPSTRQFCQEYIAMELDVLKFQSELASKRRKALRQESKKPGKVFRYKLTELSEPWIITNAELNIIVEAMSKVKNQSDSIVKLQNFFNIAVDADGCTLLDARNN
jgi:hypothetical protein